MKEGREGVKVWRFFLFHGSNMIRIGRGIKNAQELKHAASECLQTYPQAEIMHSALSV